MREERREREREREKEGRKERRKEKRGKIPEIAPNFCEKDPNYPFFGPRNWKEN